MTSAKKRGMCNAHLATSGLGQKRTAERIRIMSAISPAFVAIVATNGAGCWNSLLAAAGTAHATFFIASVRHSMSHLSSKGLLRKSTAPLLIARDRCLSFGYAVTRITGI
jgi:hypothetical protein